MRGRGGVIPPKVERERRRRVVDVLGDGEKETSPRAVGRVGMLFDLFVGVGEEGSVPPRRETIMFAVA